MKNILVLAVALVLQTSLQAAPSKRPQYDDAVELTRKMQEVISATGLWHKKSMQDRARAVQDAARLRAAIEKMLGDAPFGEFGQCKVAAVQMETYVQDLNSMSLIVEGRRQVTAPSDVFAPAFNAFHFGDAYRACQDSLEALYVAPKKK